MNELEKGLKELDLEYEVDGKQYKVPTNKENLIKLLKCSWAMQLDLQQRIDKAIEYIKETGLYCDYGDLCNQSSKDLLEILEGDKENE